MRRALIALSLAIVLGCATHPSIPTAITARPDVSIRLTPSVTLAGGAIWVNCYVPELLGPGWVRYGIVGLRTSGPERIQHVQNRTMIDHIPCGTWTAVCAVALDNGRFIERTAPVLAQGDCQ